MSTLWHMDHMADSVYYWDGIFIACPLWGLRIHNSFMCIVIVSEYQVWQLLFTTVLTVTKYAHPGKICYDQFTIIISLCLLCTVAVNQVFRDSSADTFNIHRALEVHPPKDCYLSKYHIRSLSLGFFSLFSLTWGCIGKQQSVTTL